MSATPGGDARRKAEIEAKRAKLAELRRQREERSARLTTPSARSTTPGGTGSIGAESATAVTSRKDIDDLVANLVGTPSTPTARRSAAFPPPILPSHTSHSSPGNSVAPAETTGGFTSRIGSDFEAGQPETTLPAGGETGAAAATTSTSSSLRGAPQLVDVQTELFEYPHKEKVYYTKEVQTASTSLEDDDQNKNDVGTRTQGDTTIDHLSATAEASIRKKILEEQELEREKQLQDNLKKQEEELERQLQEELRILSPEEAKVIFGTTDFSDFVENSSKVVERALTDTYDYLKDYTIAGGASDSSEGRDIKEARCFWDETLCKGRSVTGLDWSSKHPELVVASYSRSHQSLDAPDGLVLVWNLHLLDRPEFVFEAQTDVLSAVFSPFHPNLVIGGTYSGQILIWDTKAKRLPVLKTPLGAAGHTHPVYNIQVVGTQNANHLVTASTDGSVYTWMLDMLAQPQESLELLNANHTKTDEVAITCLDFPVQETTHFWVGTEEGSIFLASRFDRAGSKAGLQLGEIYRGHAAPVTAIDFHKASVAQGSLDFSDLFLSSSMDWTAKLWRIKGSTSTSNGNDATGKGIASTTNASSSARIGVGTTSAASSTAEITPLLSFEETNDYVMDVKWHRTLPSIFALVDAGGNVHLYNLVRDTERPYVVSQLSSQGLNKLSFDRSKEGRFLAVGGVDGRLRVLDLASLLATVLANADKDAAELQRLLSASRGSG